MVLAGGFADEWIGVTSECLVDRFPVAGSEVLLASGSTSFPRAACAPNGIRVRLDRGDERFRLRIATLLVTRQLLLERAYLFGAGPMLRLEPSMSGPAPG